MVGAELVALREGTSASEGVLGAAKGEGWKARRPPRAELMVGLGYTASADPRRVDGEDAVRACVRVRVGVARPISVCARSGRCVAFGGPPRCGLCSMGARRTGEYMGGGGGYVGMHGRKRGWCVGGCCGTRVGGCRCFEVWKERQVQLLRITADRSMESDEG